MDTLKGTLSDVVKITGTLSNALEISADLSIPKIVYPPIYQGAVNITPTDQTQILNTSDKYLTDDIIINPIPSNYGLITWNGSFLTVS